MRRLTLPFLVLAAALAIVACGGSAATTAPSAAASQPAASEPAGAAACAVAPAGASPVVEVEIKDFKFSPDPISATVGDVVAWTNADSASHTASLADGTCTTESLSTGITGGLVFNTAGTYTYQCNIHPGQMKDYTIEVQ